VQAVIADTEVMPDLVDHGAPDLLDHLILTGTDCADRLAVDRDLIWQDGRVIMRAFGQGDADVKAEKVALAGVVIDYDGDIAHYPAQLRREPVQGRRHDVLEPLRSYVDHDEGPAERPTLATDVRIMSSCRIT
jgi:hypothetical protein